MKTDEEILTEFIEERNFTEEHREYLRATLSFRVYLDSYRVTEAYDAFMDSMTDDFPILGKILRKIDKFERWIKSL